ncbi:4'-phosphopantetheinyl transferase family protein, partial [Corallococcus exiguus]|uniref:4'-phosphopantetheinyl transferase family protein n=1 Tax=Corallococcus exiguus TaxID=83462 RepID=UPI001B8B078B
LRLRREEDRASYRLSHGALRMILAREKRCEPSDLVLGRDPLGKPLCEGGPSFNMSHSAGMTVVAWSWSQALGVDVEELAAEPHPSASLKSAMADEDVAVLPRLARQPHHAETVLWAIKEASLKLTGEVMRDPRDLRVRAFRNGAFKIDAASAASAPLPAVFARLVVVGPRHVSALATYGPAPTPRVVVWHDHFNEIAYPTSHSAHPTSHP